MAFNDIKLKMYNGSILVDYKDKAHAYWVTDLSVEGAKARRVKGVTTIKDATLEKKGLMTWPMGLALGELFGFYNFTNDQGEKMLGFSRDKGTMWPILEANMEAIVPGTKFSREKAEIELLEPVKSASEAWFRQKKTGADIGSMVHDKIEQFLILKKVNPITLEEYKAGQEFADPAEESAWDKKAEIEVAQANKAFSRFMDWWDQSPYELEAAEQLVYSRKLDYCGTFDASLKTKDGKRILVDWKTSNASSSREAAAPQGIYYDFFVQLGAYAEAWMEMGKGSVDDLMVVSARKDGSFDTKLASEVGLTVQDCRRWWKATNRAYNYMSKTKAELLKGATK